MQLHGIRIGRVDEPTQLDERRFDHGGDALSGERFDLWRASPVRRANCSTSNRVSATGSTAAVMGAAATLMGQS
jgi:hypothetical protein